MFFKNEIFCLVNCKRFEKCLTGVILCSKLPGRNTYQDGVNFIRQKFVGLNRNPSRKTVYTHVTCATDTHNIQYVFQSCTEIIISEHLRDAGLVWAPMSIILLLSVFPYFSLLYLSLKIFPSSFHPGFFSVICSQFSNIFHSVSSYDIRLLYHTVIIALLSFYAYWKSVILCDSNRFINVSILTVSFVSTFSSYIYYIKIMKTIVLYKRTQSL